MGPGSFPLKLQACPMYQDSISFPGTNLSEYTGWMFANITQGFKRAVQESLLLPSLRAPWPMAADTENRFGLNLAHTAHQIRNHGQP
jgi:hypothetical protein